MLGDSSMRIPSGCAVTAVMDAARPISASAIVDSIACMRERSSGLGGGFAIYGCYPAVAQSYALHVATDTDRAHRDVGQLIGSQFRIVLSEPVPTRPVPGLKRPALHRYFLTVSADDPAAVDHLAQLVAMVNMIDGAFVVSSGRNMAVFKGVGYPEDIAELYRLDDYRGHAWIAHGRFPTNTPGWWGGAHPFGYLDWSVVHNGEISSYGTNRAYLEMFGYEMACQTDTEVIVYALDWLVRRRALTLEQAAAVLAPPLWETIDRLPLPAAQPLRRLRNAYASLLLNGPFSIIAGWHGGLMALNDRLKLRPLVAAEDGSRFYCASEEAAIRRVCPDPARLWHPSGGEPVIRRWQTEMVTA